MWPFKPKKTATVNDENSDDDFYDRNLFRQKVPTFIDPDALNKNIIFSIERIRTRTDDEQTLITLTDEEDRFREYTIYCTREEHNNLVEKAKQQTAQRTQPPKAKRTK